MKHPLITLSIYIISVLTLMITFFIFYQDNQEILRSFVAASMSAILVYGSLLMISWLAQVFMK